VSAVRVELTHGPATPTDDPGFPSGTMQLHVDRTSLEVDQTDGITWLINEPQDFFFRKGLVAADEDTTRWFILVWRDLDLSGRPSALPGAATPAVKSMSWGRLKALY
jgi:hypothetical protein